MKAPFDDYQVGPVLGAGGSATVSLACLRRPGGFSRVVALKRLHPNLARDPAYRALLESEGRLGGKLASVNVVHVLDLVHDGVEPVLVLEHIAGLPLSNLIDHRPVPPPIVCALLLDVLRGLDALHSSLPEVHLHRDVCPGNVLVGIDGVGRLADFGIARAVAGTRNTDFGVVKGTLRYMSPEQLADGPLDPRSDLFSAAVIAWELLAGRPLFDANDPGAIVRQLLVDPVPPLPASCDAPAALRELIEAALSRSPADRPADAKTMQTRLLASASAASVSELSAFVTERGQDTLGPLAETIASWSARAASEPADEAGAVVPGRDRPPRSRPWTVALAPTLVGTLLLAGGYAFTRTSRGDEAVAASIGRGVLAPPSQVEARIAEPVPSASLSPVVPPAPSASTSRGTPAISKRAGPPPPIPASAAPAFCDPPYRIEPSGVRTLRPECL